MLASNDNYSQEDVSSSAGNNSKALLGENSAADKQSSAERKTRKKSMQFNGLNSLLGINPKSK